MAASPQIGSLRERLTIQEESRTPDGGGGATLAWVDVATVWARVEPLRVLERVVAMGQQAEVSHKVTMRHRDDVTAGHRLLWRGRALNVRGVSNPDERRAYLELLCDEGAAV